MSGFTGKVERTAARILVMDDSAGVAVISGEADRTWADVLSDDGAVNVEAMRKYLRLWDAEQAVAEVQAGTDIGEFGIQMYAAQGEIEQLRAVLEESKRTNRAQFDSLMRARDEANKARDERDQAIEAARAAEKERDSWRANFGTQLDRAKLLANLLHDIAAAAGVSSYVGWEDLAEQVKAKIASATKELDAAMADVRRLTQVISCT